MRVGRVTPSRGAPRRCAPRDRLLLPAAALALLAAMVVTLGPANAWPEGEARVNSLSIQRPIRNAPSASYGRREDNVVPAVNDATSTGAGAGRNALPAEVTPATGSDAVAGAVINTAAGGGAPVATAALNGDVAARRVVQSEHPHRRRPELDTPTAAPPPLPTEDRDLVRLATGAPPPIAGDSSSTNGEALPQQLSAVAKQYPPQQRQQQQQQQQQRKLQEKSEHSVKTTPTTSKDTASAGRPRGASANGDGDDDHVRRLAASAAPTQPSTLIRLAAAATAATEPALAGPAGSPQAPPTDTPNNQQRRRPNNKMCKATTATAAAAAVTPSGRRRVGVHDANSTCARSTTSWLPASGHRSQATNARYALSNTSIWMLTQSGYEEGCWLEFVVSGRRQTATVAPFAAGWRVVCDVPASTSGGDGDTRLPHAIVAANASQAIVFHPASASLRVLGDAEHGAGRRTAAAWCDGASVFVYSTAAAAAAGTATAAGSLLRYDTELLQVTTSALTGITLEGDAEVRHIYACLPPPPGRVAQTAAGEPPPVGLYMLVSQSPTANGTSNSHPQQSRATGLWRLLQLSRDTANGNALTWYVIARWNPSAGDAPPEHLGEAVLTWTDSLGRHLCFWGNKISGKIWCLDMILFQWSRRTLRSRLAISVHLLNGTTVGEHSVLAADSKDHQWNSLPLAAWSSAGSAICVFWKPASCIDSLQPTCLSAPWETDAGGPAKAEGAVPLTSRNGSVLTTNGRLQAQKPAAGQKSASGDGGVSASSGGDPATGDLGAGESLAAAGGAAATTEDIADEEIDGDELDLELGSPWHDSESGVFDSIVFCATSAVAICLLWALWCVRHCAPFPKEALLPLRDPPSVRYTAIPDGGGGGGSSGSQLLPPTTLA